MVMIEHARLCVILPDMWLFFRNPAYAGHRSKPASKHDSVTHIWEDTETLGKGVFTTAKAQLQAQSEHDSMVKVLFLRGKLNRLWKTFDDKATLARLPDRGANIEKKIQDLTAELEEAELEAAKKESLAKLDIAAMSDVLSKLSMGH
jgi:hypothetical protein